jgi:hypothetical protein
MYGSLVSRSLPALCLFAAAGMLQAHDMQICKQSDPVLQVQGSFAFTVFDYATNSIIASPSVAVGTCSAILQNVGDGPFQVTETAVPGDVVTAITAVIRYNFNWHPPTNGLISSNLSLRTAEVFAVGGATTIVTFTNGFKPTATEGCTPGYWKQTQHFDSWVTYTPTRTVGSIFTGVDSSLSGETLLAALQGGGGPGLVGAETILLRAAVAALLNTSNPSVHYPLTSAQVISEVNAALATSDPSTIPALATTLDNYNNGPGGCPLS